MINNEYYHDQKEPWNTKKNDVKFIKINIKSTMNELRCEHIK